MQSSFDDFDNNDDVHYEDASDYSQNTDAEGESDDSAVRRPRSMWTDSTDSTDSTGSTDSDGAEGRDAYAARSAGDSPETHKRVLLRAVNDVLNQSYSHKTLFSTLEFDNFRQEVISQVPEMENDPGVYVCGIAVAGPVTDANPSGKEVVDIEDSDDPVEVDAAIDSVLKDLFFHAGGTLVGVLLPRAERLVERERAPKSVVPLSRPADSDSEEPRRPLASVIGLPADYDRRSGVSPSFLKESASKYPDSPWRSTCSKLAALASRYFDSESLDSDKFAALRRLFFLSLNVDKEAGAAFEAAGSFESLIENIQDSVDEASPDSELFDFDVLEEAYNNLNNRLLLEQKTQGELEEITQLILLEFARRLNAADAETISADSDFDREYQLITKYVVSERFANRQFNPDFSDFDDFEREFYRVAGPRAATTTAKLVELFRNAGGRFMEVAQQTSELTVDASTMSRGELIKKVVAENFKDGLDLSSADDLSRFVDICAASGQDLNMPEEKLRSVISRCTTTVDGRVYSIADKNKKELKQAIEALMRVGAAVVYYEAYFAKYESRLVAANIVNWRVLRAVLAGCFPKYFFYEYYFESKRSELTEFGKVRGEILRLWGGVADITVEKLADRVNIPEDRLRQALDVDFDEFAPSEKGYTRLTTDSSPLSTDEEESLNDGFVSGFTYELPCVVASGKEFSALLSEGVLPSVEKEEKRSTTKSAAQSSPLRGRRKSANATSKAVSDDDVSVTQTVFDGFAPVESVAEEQEEPVVEPAPKKSSSSKRASKATTETAPVDWRKHANLIARILSTQFKNGLALSDLELFREKAAAADLTLGDSDDEVMQLIKRVGFVCEDRVYVVSQKTKAAVMEIVDAWFNNGGSVIFYDAFFNRHQDVLTKGGIPTVAVLENRLRKYYPDAVFEDQYFEAVDDERELSIKIREDVFSVWDGSSSKRLNDLVEAVYVPRDVLERTLGKDSDNFTVRSNGYWSRVMKGSLAKKRVVPRRKTAKRRSDSDSSAS